MGAKYSHVVWEQFADTCGLFHMFDLFVFSWILDPDPRSRTQESRIQVPGSRILGPESRTQGPRSSVLDPGSRIEDPGS